MSSPEDQFNFPAYDKRCSSGIPLSNLKEHRGVDSAPHPAFSLITSLHGSQTDCLQWMSSLLRPAPRLLPFWGPGWWVHNCIMCVVSGMNYGRIYLACLCIYSDVPVSLSGSTAWLWIRVFCHKSWVQDRAWQLFHAAAFLYISV